MRVGDDRWTWNVLYCSNSNSSRKRGLGSYADRAWRHEPRQQFPQPQPQRLPSPHPLQHQARRRLPLHQCSEPPRPLHPLRQSPPRPARPSPPPPLGSIQHHGPANSGAGNSTCLTKKSASADSAPNWLPVVNKRFLELAMSSRDFACWVKHRELRKMPRVNRLSAKRASYSTKSSPRWDCGEKIFTF